MTELLPMYIMQVLATFAFTLFAYYLLKYLSKKMNFKVKDIQSFKTAIILAAFDLLLSILNLLSMGNTAFWLFLLVLEIAGFYCIVQNIYKTNWKHTLTISFLLLLALLAAQMSVFLGMLAFISMYLSV